MNLINATDEAIAGFVKDISHTNAWLIVLLSIIVVAIIGAIEYKAKDEFSFGSLTGGMLVDLKYLVFTYFFFALAFLLADSNGYNQSFYELGQVATSIVVFVRAKRIIELMMKRTRENKLPLLETLEKAYKGMSLEEKVEYSQNVVEQTQELIKEAELVQDFNHEPASI